MSAIIASCVLMSNAAIASESELAAENYKQADQNGDGKLPIKEFEVFINLNADDGLGNAATIRALGKYSMAFDRVDADMDQFITPPEIQAMR